MWDQQNPQMADYVSIDVGGGIEPDHALVAVGGVIRYSSPIISRSGQSTQDTQSLHLSLTLIAVSRVNPLYVSVQYIINIVENIKLVCYN